MSFMNKVAILLKEKILKKLFIRLRAQEIRV
jgi:hypothetical protein